MFELMSVLGAVITAAAPLAGPAEMWGAIVKDFSQLNSWSALSALGAVILVDLVMAGDNAIVVGALAAGLPAEQRKKVIMIGVIAALVLRIAFAVVAAWLLTIVGLVFVGGLLLLWVAWKMYRDLTRDEATESPGSPEIEGDENSGIPAAKSFWGAVWAVGLADVSMSLDNVLAVAAASKGHPGIMIVGLVFAVILMGIAANIIAKYMEKYKWITWIGVAVIIIVSGKMIYDGWVDPNVGVGRYVMAWIGG
jgi:YjbE family integral membrane protein